MKIFFIILFITLYTFFVACGMLYEQTDEYLEKSMKRAYNLAKKLEDKE